MKRHLLAASVGVAFPLIGVTVVTLVAAAQLSAEGLRRLAHRRAPRGSTAHR